MRNDLYYPLLFKNAKEQDIGRAEGNSRRCVKFLLLAWIGMLNASTRQNSGSLTPMDYYIDTKFQKIGPDCQIPRQITLTQQDRMGCVP
jgi:hypothetical protein